MTKELNDIALEVGEGGCMVGRDARIMTKDELTQLGHKKQNPVKIMRQKCIDCCGGVESEVRKCVAYDCDLWPYRHGTNPFTNRTGGTAFKKG